MNLFKSMLHTKPPSLLSLKAASIKTSNSKTSKRPKRFNARLFPYVSTVFVIAFSAQAIADQSAWTLMWSDEFEYQGLPLLKTLVKDSKSWKKSSSFCFSVSV